MSGDFRVLRTFADLEDGNHIYRAGETYPRDGVKPTLARIEELSGSGNKIGAPLIKAMESSGKPAVKAKRTVKKKS